MDEIHVTGKASLSGEIFIQGSKNAALPMMAASLMHRGRSVLKGCPRISDVFCMEEILKSLGAVTWWKTYASVLGEKQELFKTEKTELGKCPRCKSLVYEGKKNYYCSNKECGFTMWKNDRFFEERKTAFTPKIAAALLKSGKATVKKLYSPKTGKTYDGTVLLADTGGKYVNYKVTISKNKELE